MKAQSNNNHFNVSQDGKDASFKSYQDLLRFTYAETPCQEDPEICKPRRVRNVIFDADDTIWETLPISSVSDCHPPYRQLSKNKLEVTCTKMFPVYQKKTKTYETRTIPGTVTLEKSLHKTLDQLRRRGIKTSIASNNEPGTVQRILKAFQLGDKFDYVESSWRSKPEMVTKIAKKSGIPPEETIFINDATMNVLEVYNVTGALSLVMHMDMESLIDVFNYIEDS